MKVWILSAICGSMELPLCYTRTEQEMYEYMEGHKDLWYLYNEEKIWLHEEEVELPNPYVHANDWFRMFDAG